MAEVQDDKKMLHTIQKIWTLTLKGSYRAYHSLLPLKSETFPVSFLLCILLLLKSLTDAKGLFCLKWLYIFLLSPLLEIVVVCKAMVDTSTTGISPRLWRVLQRNLQPRQGRFHRVQSDGRRHEKLRRSL